MKLIIILFCLVVYTHSHTGCTTCYPGTSVSICPHRKATDPIICGSDGRKYTPCIFNCAKICNPNLGISGCGSSCDWWSEINSCPPPTPTTPHTTTPVTEPTTAPTAPPTTPSPSICTADSEAPCNVPFIPPTGACGVFYMKTECLACRATSPAKGQCVDGGGVLCTNDAVAPCNVAFITPQDSCAIDLAFPTCTACTAGSPAKGGCAPWG